MRMYHREDDPECYQQEWSWFLTQLLLICLVSLYINKEFIVECRLYFRTSQPVEDLVVCRLHLAVSMCHPTCFSSPALATAFFVKQVLKEHSCSTHRLVAWSPPACFSRWVLVLHSTVDTTSSPPSVLFHKLNWRGVPQGSSGWRACLWVSWPIWMPPYSSGSGDVLWRADSLISLQGIARVLAAPWKLFWRAGGFTGCQL